MRFVVTKDGKHVCDVILNAVSYGTQFDAAGDFVAITNLYVEMRGFPANILAIDFVAYGKNGALYRGYAVDILLR